MTSQAEASPSKGAIWTGWLLSVLPSLMLFFSGSMKFTTSPEMAKTFEDIGYPEHLALILGIVEVGSTVIYLIPRTAALGAILLTGYLGGAVAAHARLLEGKFAVPLVLGVLVWGGLYLRDPRVRALIPIRRRIS
ncbi:MAG TPA: DoxX family protein [Pirellulales bacterium]|nr:DoxX family protein [Pirellulales bacterium]